MNEQPIHKNTSKKENISSQSIEVENENEESQLKEEWIVVKKKQTYLTISICDFSKVNRYYSHKSIQNYLRYLLVQTCPNPMWLSIKRQSQIGLIIYLDLQIENNLFQSMILNKQLKFLSKTTNNTNKAIFKPSKFARQNLWENLLCYDFEEPEYKNLSIEEQNVGKQLNEQLFKKYESYLLTSTELKAHLYPSKQLPLYEPYLELKFQESQEDIQKESQLQKLILVIDCQMVITSNGFQLARATIVNYKGQVIFDQFFKPPTEILNYNTEYSGITKELLDPVANTIPNKLYPFLKENITKKTILIGHSLENDLNAMNFIYQRVIDTSVLFMRKNGTKLKLKMLTEKILKRKIQVGQHDSVEDSLATLHLVQCRVEKDQITKKKQYHLIKQIIAMKKSVLIADYALDEDLRQNTAVHFEKLKQQEPSENVFKIMKKYLRKDVAKPHLILTRAEKQQQFQWEGFYKEFDQNLQEFYQELPPYTAIFLNCQINPAIQIISEKESLKPVESSRPFCYILAK